MARASAGTSAMTRALGVLDAFSIDAPFLTVSEIARRSGYPVSSTHRIVGELTGHGLLERVDERRYRLGNRLWELGTKTPGALGLREIARPYMIALHLRVGQHVQLAVRYDNEALVLERLSAPDATVNATVVGGHMPLQHTALGLVLLAHAPCSLVGDVVELGMRPPTEHALKTRSELDRALGEARSRGYAFAPGYIYPGSCGIAVPIAGSLDAVVAALGVVVPNDGTDPEPMAGLLRRTAKGISATLLRAYLPPNHPDAPPGGIRRFLVNSSAQSMEFFEQSI